MKLYTWAVFSSGNFNFYSVLASVCKEIRYVRQVTPRPLDLHSKSDP